MLFRSIYETWGATVRKAGTTAPTLTNWHTLNIHAASNDWENRIDGTAQTTSSSNTVTFRSVPLCGRTLTLDGGVTYYVGLIEAMIIYGRKLTTQERADVNTIITNGPAA